MYVRYIDTYAPHAVCPWCACGRARARVRGRVDQVGRPTQGTQTQETERKEARAYNHTTHIQVDTHTQHLITWSQFAVRADFLVDRTSEDRHRIPLCSYPQPSVEQPCPPSQGMDAISRNSYNTAVLLAFLGFTAAHAWCWISDDVGGGAVCPRAPSLPLPSSQSLSLSLCVCVSCVPLVLALLADQSTRSPVS